MVNEQKQNCLMKILCSLLWSNTAIRHCHIRPYLKNYLIKALFQQFKHHKIRKNRKQTSSDMTNAGKHNLGTTGNYNLGTTGNHNLCTTGMHNLDTTGMHNLVTTGNHNLCTVGLHSLCTTRMHNLCTTGMHNLGTTGMHNIFSIGVRTTLKNYEIEPIVNSRCFYFLCIAYVILPQTDPKLLQKVYLAYFDKYPHTVYKAFYWCTAAIYNVSNYICSSA